MLAAVIECLLKLLLALGRRPPLSKCGSAARLRASQVLGGYEVVLTLADKICSVQLSDRWNFAPAALMETLHVSSAFL